MKKSRLLSLFAIIPCLFALSGCFFLDILSPQEEIVVDPPKIEVVSSLKINLAQSNEKLLEPTLSNSSVQNPSYVYKSSDTSVATVSSSGVVTGLKVGSCIITISLASDSSVKATVEVTIINKETKHYDYTIMLYMCGSDLEYIANKEKDDKDGFFTEDIKEILSVKNIPNSVKIIIETGGTKSWYMPSSYLEGATKISSTKLQRWEVNNETNKLKLIETLSGNEMAKEQSFSEFLSWGLDDYEADQMGVIISGHGGGIAGCAYDDNYTYKYGKDYFPHTLRTFEVANAAKTALMNSPKDKFTWIGYDCCVMQCADIATVNSDYFEYMVASQELEDAIGWNHDYYLDYLKSDTNMAPEDFLPHICDGFLADKHSDSEKSQNACYQCLSVLDLSKVDSLVTSFNGLTRSLGLTTLSRYNTAKTAFEASYNDFGDGIFGLCDFASLLKQFKNASYNTTACENALKDLLVYQKYCSKYTTAICGVNAFFPESLDHEYILQVGRCDYNNALASKFTDWRTMCVAHGDFGWETI